MWIKSIAMNLCIWSLTLAMPLDNKAVDLCRDGERGYRYCESGNALCRNDSNAPGGFSCYCTDGMIYIEESCRDIPEIQTISPVTFSKTISPSSPSSGFSNSDTQTNSSLEPETTYTFSTSTDYTSSSHSSSALTSTDIAVTDTDECSRHHCSSNATCLKLSKDFTCVCKPGFTPKKKFFVNKKHCIGNCTRMGCVALCKQMECVLESEEEESHNVTIRIEIKNSSGWPNEAITVSGVLLLLLVGFAVSTVYLAMRNRKLKKYQLYEKKQIVYKKTAQNSSQCTESPVVIPIYWNMLKHRSGSLLKKITEILYFKHGKAYNTQSC